MVLINVILRNRQPLHWFAVVQYRAIQYSYSVSQTAIQTNCEYFRISWWVYCAYQLVIHGLVVQRSYVSYYKRRLWSTLLDLNSGDSISFNAL